MDDKKQKMLLIGASVLIVGAGAGWYFMAGSGEGSTQATETGPVARREREAPPEQQVTRRAEATRDRATARQTTNVERRQRDDDGEEVDVRRRDRARDNRRNVKKEEMFPAA